MNKTALFWILAVLITGGSAIYQRHTGPSYPLKGTVAYGDGSITYALTRTHGGPGDQDVPVIVPDASMRGEIIFKRFKSYDPWAAAPLIRHADTLVGSLPHQPMAGKIEYYILLHGHSGEMRLPADGLVVTRFKGDVPMGILVPHIAVMFLVMLLSTMAAFEALRKGRDPRRLAYLSLGLIVIGGFIFGPLVQKYAFDAYWSGVPFGFDLTDNKTLIAFIVWLIAAIILVRKGNVPLARRATVAAAIITFVVFLIPHSVLGSEIDHRKGQTPEAPASPVPAPPSVSEAPVP
jgi:hypothetical protein